MRFNKVFRLRRIISVIILLSLTLLICNLISCEKSTPPPEQPSGIISHSSGCKISGFSKTGKPISTDTDCVEYQYSDEYGLVLRHLNAGFNCCSEASANIMVEGNLITVEETESGDLCHCLCLYDIEYNIKNLTPGEYTIKFVGLCLDDDDEPLEFTVDLGLNPSGVYCLDRNHYPWADQ